MELLARSDETGRMIPPEDRKALMASVKAQMTELAALIGDLQELARPDAAEPGPLQVVSLHEITRTALRRARLRGPELTITEDLAPWYVRAEPAALERAIVNVLDNAVKFSPPGGTVDVRLHRGELTVRDRGPGIPAEDLPHVFERFWRSPTARRLPARAWACPSWPVRCTSRAARSPCARPRTTAPAPWRRSRCRGRRRRRRGCEAGASASHPVGLCRISDSTRPDRWFG